MESSFLVERLNTGVWGFNPSEFYLKEENMQINCNQCGKKFPCSANFCQFCGTEAPRKTVLFDDVKETICEPKYCVHCKTANEMAGFYCSNCGENLHKKPDKETFYCGKCAEINESKAKLCCVCGLAFEDWFSMGGEIAERLGYKGNLVIKEKMTGYTYHFLTGDSLTIGRNKDNDIVIPCSWVSGHHCRFDFEQKTLTDTSTNGTFVNRTPEPIKSEPIPYISEFNIAGSFTFPVLKKENLFCFHLGAIMDEDECRREGDGEAFDKLRKHYYLHYRGDFKILIQKLDGVIPERKKPGVSHYIIQVESGYYYFSDLDRNIEHMLIMKENNPMPANWVVEYGGGGGNNH
jgi:hypothetical protein